MPQWGIKIFNNIFHNFQRFPLCVASLGRFGSEGQGGSAPDCQNGVTLWPFETSLHKGEIDKFAQQLPSAGGAQRSRWLIFSHRPLGESEPVVSMHNSGKKPEASLTSKTALEIIKQVGARVVHAAQMLHLFLQSPRSAQRWVHPPQSSTSVLRKAALRLTAARPPPVPAAPVSAVLPTGAASHGCVGQAAKPAPSCVANALPPHLEPEKGACALPLGDETATSSGRSGANGFGVAGREMVRSPRGPAGLNREYVLENILYCSARSLKREIPELSFSSTVTSC